MRGLYARGVAIRGGPESCVGVREGVGEALTGVRAGWAIEPRKDIDRDADALTFSGRRYRPAAFSRVAGWVSRGLWNLGMCAISPCARTGRSHVLPAVSPGALLVGVRGVGWVCEGNV
jgi:hypothetical protein